MKIFIFSLLLSWFISSGCGKSDVKFSADIPSLKFAQVIFRHGDRTPLLESIYPNDPYKSQVFWPVGYGQLTKKGQERMREFGEFLRYRYGGFLSGVYTSSEVYAMSSEIQRCIDSAEETLNGLFPSEKLRKESKWHPIPIHTIPSNIDNKLDFSAECHKYKEAQDSFLNSEEMRKVHEKHKALFHVLSFFSGVKVSSVLNVCDLYDTLYIEAENGYALPNWTHNYFPDQMKHLAAKAFEFIAANEEMQRLRGGPLLKELLFNADLKTGAKQGKLRGLKLVLYSAHDSTISSLLMALGVFNKEIPPYGSAVFFELHKYRTENFHFIRIYYRNDSNLAPFELEIPNCSYPCRLDRLVNLKRRVLIRNWASACESGTMDKIEGFFNSITTSAGSLFKKARQYLHIF